MDEKQLAFLERIGIKIPQLFASIKEGNDKAEFIIGYRRINGRSVHLKLVVQVVDPGGNPLANHTHRPDNQPGTEPIKPRRRRPRRRAKL